MKTETKPELTHNGFTPGPWYFRPEEPSVEAECPTEPGFFSTIADCGKSRTGHMRAVSDSGAITPDLLERTARAALAKCEPQQPQAFPKGRWE